MKYMEELLITKFVEKELECNERKGLNSIEIKNVEGGVFVTYELSVLDYDAANLRRKITGELEITVLELIAFTFDSLHPEGL